MGGFAPTSSTIFFGKYADSPVTIGNFIVADLFACKPCELYFDEQAALKEDYDYTLQHLQRYGGVVRFNQISPGFEHRKNAGGAVSYRTTEKEAAAVKYVLGKWPDYLKLNPKRANQIILTWKTPQQQLLGRSVGQVS